MRDDPTTPRPPVPRRDLATFAIAFAAYGLLILLPILRANRDCNDDLIRALHGNYGWNNNGRHLANLVMRALEFGNARLVDIAPLPQLLAIGVLAWIAVLLARRYAIASPFAAAAIAFPLGAQPFFLENLSYKFDSVCMALALLAALAPILACAPTRRGWALGVLALLASLALYQPAIDAFLVFALVEAAAAPADDGPGSRARRLLARAAQAALAMVVYRALFGATLKDWMHEHGTLVHSLAQWPVVAANARDFAALVANALTPREWCLLGPVVALLMLTPMAAGLSAVARGRRRRSRVQTLALGAAAIALPLLALPAAAGPMLLLEHPVLMPRVLPGVGALLAGGLVVVRAAWPARAAPGRATLVLAGVLALAFAVIAAAYGNAARAQDAYETAIATQLADDLAEASAAQPLRDYRVFGTAGLAPLAAHAAEHVPLVAALVPSYLREDDFNTRNFLLRYVPAVPERDGDAGALRAQACAAAPTHVRRAYRLVRVGDTAVVLLGVDAASACEAP